MSVYRCYFIDANGCIAGPPAAFKASHDDEALAHAKRLCDGTPKCTGIELWCGAQRIGAYKPTK